MAKESDKEDESGSRWATTTGEFFRSSRWRKVRAAHLLAHPYCECGCGRVADGVFYCVSIADHPQLAFSSINLIALTIECAIRRRIQTPNPAKMPQVEFDASNMRARFEGGPYDGDTYSTHGMTVWRFGRRVFVDPMRDVSYELFVDAKEAVAFFDPSLRYVKDLAQREHKLPASWRDLEGDPSDSDHESADEAV